MPWPFLNGVIKVVVTWGFEGQPAINVHFVLMDTPASPIPDATLVNVATTLFTAIDDNWKTRAGNGWTCENIEAIDWSREAGNTKPAVGAFPITGVSAVQGSPASLCTVVSQRTDRTGRSYRGRNYIPGLDIAGVTDNTVNADVITDLGLLYSDWRTALATINTQHVVFSTYAEGIKRATTVATPITSTIIDNRVDTQRRRLPPMS